MLKRLKHLLIGDPLPNEQLHGEKLSVFWGLPIMASDAVSSVAYAVEEILWVLVLAIGLSSYQYMFYIALAIVALLLILVFSYRQTIDSYPHGGGSYTVARQNLGQFPGILASASLIIDYILTVAVSTSAGTAAITSALPALLPYNVWITLLMIGLLTLGNLRGVKESARLFAFPTYIFIVSMLIMIAVGLFRLLVLGETPESLYPVPRAVENVSLFLLVRAFSAGCSGVSGIEAVSNAIPNFAAPAQKKAKQVLSLLALSVLLIFGGTSYLASRYHAVPTYEVTVLSQIATHLFGGGFMYYVIQISTAVILIMAANTSYAGLPTLLSLVASDGFAPRQFTFRGGRLGFSNGIIALSILAGILVVIYGAETHDLVPLYAIGVFTSFTLSQLGMLVKWVRGREKGWRHKAMINGLGAVMTIITVLSIAYSKLLAGAWISIALMAILCAAMEITHRHYQNVAKQLSLRPSEVQKETAIIEVKKHFIVMIGSLNKSSLKAINYARQLSDGTNITAFHVSTDLDHSQGLRRQWEECGIPVPLVIRYSPYREIIEPLVAYLESEEHAYRPGDMISVVVPQFVVKRRWMNIYHSQTAFNIRRKLLRDRHIAMISVPYVLDEA